MNPKTFFCATISAAAMLLCCACNHSTPTTLMKNETNIFPKGAKATAHFIGDAYVNILVPKDHHTTYAVGDVVFAPGCRNNWHTHQVRQILLVTAGKGWYRERGGEARPLAAGDVVVISAGVEHWHGATATDTLEHVVITDYAGDDCVVWLDPVTDAEYAALPAAF